MRFLPNTTTMSAQRRKEHEVVSRCFGNGPMVASDCMSRTQSISVARWVSAAERHERRSESGTAILVEFDLMRSSAPIVLATAHAAKFADTAWGWTYCMGGETLHVSRSLQGLEKRVYHCGSVCALCFFPTRQPCRHTEHEVVSLCFRMVASNCMSQAQSISVARRTEAADLMRSSASWLARRRSGLEIPRARLQRFLRVPKEQDSYEISARRDVHVDTKAQGAGSCAQDQPFLQRTDGCKRLHAASEEYFGCSLGVGRLETRTRVGKRHCTLSGAHGVQGSRNTFRTRDCCGD